MKDLSAIYIKHRTHESTSNEVKYDFCAALEEFVETDEDISDATGDHYQPWPKYNDERFNGCPIAYSHLKEARKNLILNSTKRVNISKVAQYILSEAEDFINYNLTICCGDPLAIIGELNHHNRIAKEIELVGAQAQFVIQNKQEELTALGYDQDEANPNKWKINAKRILENKYSELNHLYTEQNTQLKNLQNAYDLLATKNHQTYQEYEQLKGENQQLISNHEELSIKFDEKSNTLAKLQEEFQELGTNNHILFDKHEKLKDEHESQSNTLSTLQNKFQELGEKNHLLFHEHEELKKNSVADLNTNIQHRALPQLETLKYLSKIIDIIPTGEQAKKGVNTKARRILSTVNSRTDLSNDAHHRFAQKFTLYNKSNSLICTFIPKNGCSNLRYSFAMANGLIESKEEFDWIHSNNTTMMASNEELTSAAMNFIILRCPFARIASYFTDKILSSTDNVGDKSYDLAQSIFTDDEESELTFEKFVDRLWHKPQLIQEDIHIKHQSDFLIMQDYDYWFDLTEFEEMKSLLKKECNFKLYDTRSLTKHTSKGFKKADNRYFGDISTHELARLKQDQQIIPQYQSLYNDSSIEKIAILYLSDLLLYTNKINNIPEPSRSLINQSMQIL